MSTPKQQTSKKNADADVYDDETLEIVHVLMIPLKAVPRIEASHR